MATAEQRDFISVEDYLSGELQSPSKHEYVAGVVYAMSGGNYAHNLIASNILIALGSRLRGKRCRALNSDSKVRILFPTHTRFYYPDASVVCPPNQPDGAFQDAPAIVVEVLSKATRRIDQGEKKDAYLALPSLAVYLLVEQDVKKITVYRRRSNGFDREVHSGPEAIVPLAEIEAELPLAEVYEAVELTPEPEDE